MSYSKLECDIVVTELHAYDFIIKDLVIKGGVICAGLSVPVCVLLQFIYDSFKNKIPSKACSCVYAFIIH